MVYLGMEVFLMRKVRLLNFVTQGKLVIVFCAQPKHFIFKSSDSK